VARSDANDAGSSAGRGMELGGWHL
jgi:hypothetical protein